MINKRIIKPVGMYVEEQMHTQGKNKKNHSKMTDKKLLWKENVELHGINFSSITINRLFVTYMQRQE